MDTVFFPKSHSSKGPVTVRKNNTQVLGLLHEITSRVYRSVLIACLGKLLESYIQFLPEHYMNMNMKNPLVYGTQ